MSVNYKAQNSGVIITEVHIVKTKRYLFYALAVVLLIGGGLGIVISALIPENAFEFRSAGIVLLMSSVYLVRNANVRSGKGKVPLPHDAGLDETPRVSRRLWIVSALSVVGVIVTYMFLYKDAQDGYHQYWPLYAFTGASLFCTGVLSSLAARFAS